MKAEATEEEESVRDPGPKLEGGASVLSSSSCVGSTLLLEVTIGIEVRR